MKFGMLWYSNDPKKSLEAKILEAKTYYETKYSKKPDTCIVNPGLLVFENQVEDTVITEIEISGLKVKPSKSIMPNHFLIGNDKDTKKPELKDVRDL